MTTLLKFSLRLFLITNAFVVVAGCSHMTHSTHQLVAGASGKVQEKAYVFDVEVPGQPKSELMGVFLAAPNSENKPIVLMVPGAGNSTFLGSQKSNGAHTYSKPLNITQMWAHELADAGFSSFSYNKRTCRAGQDHLCRNNAVTDIYKKGPVALSEDVDAACRMLRRDLGVPSEKIILWTHGQGGQVVLSSECGRRAKVVIITSPMTDRVDLMLVRTLHHRASLLRAEAEAETVTELKKKSLRAKALNISNRAESFKATFLSIESDRFIDTASFLGVPLSFWYGWRKSTEDIDLQLAKQKGNVILFQGKNDTNYSDEDQRNLLRFGKMRNVKLVQIPGADHYLIEQNKISTSASHIAIDALIQAWDN